MSSDSTIPLDVATLEANKEIPIPRLLRLDKRSRRVWIGNKELLPPLSVSQYQLLELLSDNPDRVVSRAELIQAVWGKEDAVGISDQALDALILLWAFGALMLQRLGDLKPVPVQQALVQRWGQVPTDVEASAYDALRFILLDAIRRAGTIETEAVNQGVETTNVRLPLHAISSSPLRTMSWWGQVL
jgi:hypothetical protein